MGYIKEKSHGSRFTALQAVELNRKHRPLLMGKFLDVLSFILMEPIDHLNNLGVKEETSMENSFLPNVPEAGNA